MERKPGQPVGLRDIADAFGISKQTAYTWAARPDFPEPSATVNRTTRLWAWGRVEQWAASVGRAPIAPTEPDLGQPIAQEVGS